MFAGGSKEGATGFLSCSFVVTSAVARGHVLYLAAEAELLVPFGFLVGFWLTYSSIFSSRLGSRQ